MGKGKEHYENMGSTMWYDGVADVQKATKPNPDQLLIELKDEAKKCHDSDVASYNIKNAKTNSNFQWMKTVMSKGVVSDKIAAFIVSIQDSPIHNLETISNLVGMVKVGKKKECIIVMEHLVEVFLTNLLPPGRKLIPFKERPLTTLNDLSSGNAITRKKYLALWYFEDQLKETYASFVLALNTVAHDTVDSNKEKALSTMYKLLAGHPEQEKNLLMYIVNKLGDPSKTIASKSTYCLSELLKQHSNMQGVVLGEIEKLLFRANISPRAQYYGLCFLTQFYMCHEASDVARRLIEVYFSFFKACVKKGEVNSRMMSALLMGVNRAYPYAKLEMDKVSDHVKTIYRIVHIANFNIGLHALALLYQVSNNSDRFYCALYKKLLDPQIANTTHQAMLLSLLYKALSNDTQTDRIKVFIKRLLQLSIYMQPPVACGILYIVSQLINKKPDLSALFVKSSEFSVKEDNEEDDNEEEKYEDIKVATDDNEEDDAKQELEEPSSEDVPTEIGASEKNVAPGWVHNSSGSIKQTHQPLLKYDGLNRNPLYAGGRFCAYTELNILRNHHHPSVSLFARNLLSGKPIQYSGDPLKDFSLIRFLDRFAFKNPKRPEEIPKQGCHPTFGKRKNYRPRGTRSLPVNSHSYLNVQESNIPVDEMFLYTFLHRRKNKPRKDDEDESDLESVGSEEFEDMLDKMTGANKDIDEELDYMDEVQENLKSGKKKKNEVENDEINDEAENYSDENGDEDMEEDMNEEDKELIGLSDDDEGSDIVFDSEDEIEPVTKTKNKKKKDDIASLFASAEEFASLLEDEGGSKVAPGSSEAWSNKDNANVKQVEWEQKRNRFNTFPKGNKKSWSGPKANNKRKWSSKNNFQNKKNKFK